MVVKSLREQHVADTRRALIAAARRAWSEQGFGTSSLDDVCARAGVTKGALYHHFRNKADLFSAVYAEVEADLVRAGTTAVDASDDLWDQLRTASLAFLKVCARKDSRRIVLEAPAVLGWEKTRAIEREHTLGQLEAALASAAASGVIDSGSPAVLAQLLTAVLHEAGMIVAGSPRDEPRVEHELDELLGRLRSRA